MHSKQRNAAAAEVKSRGSGAGFLTLERWLGEYDCLFLPQLETAPSFSRSQSSTVADPETIRRALCRDTQGRALGPLGVALDLFMGRTS